MLKKISSFVLALVMVFAFAACGSKSDTDWLKSAYNLDLPDDAVVEFSINKIGPQGEGNRYIVFKFESEPADLIADFELGLELDQYRFDRSQSFSDLNVPEEYLPDWEEDFLQKTFTGIPSKNGTPSNRTLLTIYFPNTLRLFCYRTVYSWGEY